MPEELARRLLVGRVVNRWPPRPAAAEQPPDAGADPDDHPHDEGEHSDDDGECPLSGF
jgi:hypothetical protein